MAEGIPAYDELRLRIEKGDAGSYRLLAFGPDDSATSQAFSLPFSDLELENFVLNVGATRRRTRGFRSPQMETAKRFGSELCAAVFQGSVRDVYLSARNSADERNRGLRVTLSLSNVPELMRVPWEFLYEERSFLAQSVWTPVVRSLDLTNVRPPRKVSLPLRVLGVVSSPEGFAPLDVEGEKAKLEEALGELRSEGLIDLAWVESATMEEVERAVGAPQEEHVFHYIGHGAYDERTESGTLILENAHGGAREVTGEELCMLLRDERSLRLAVLNSCEGARSGRVDPFSGVASSLVGCGVPAVVGMQFEITDEAAKTFSARLYTALAQGFPVDAALAQARKALFAAEHDIEFGTPVLFLRGRETRLFDVEESDKLPSREQAVLGESNFAVRLERRPDGTGGMAVWQLTIENTGGCALHDVVPRRADGKALAEPVELEIGRRHVVRWRETKGREQRELITVSACDPSGSRISEQVLVHSETQGGAPTGELAVSVPPQPRGADVADRTADENRELFDKHADQFESNLHAAQRNELRKRIEGGETLLGMCRCAEPGAVARFVAALLTSRRLIWCRETVLSSATAGIVNWRDVRSVESRAPEGIKLNLSDGSAFALTLFKGQGVRIEDDTLEFTPEALRERLSELVGATAGPSGESNGGPSAADSRWTAEVTEAGTLSRALRVRLGEDTHVVKYKIGWLSDFLELDGETIVKGSKKGDDGSTRVIEFEVSDAGRSLPAEARIERTDLSLIKRFALSIDGELVYDE